MTAAPRHPERSRGTAAIPRRARRRARRAPATSRNAFVTMPDAIRDNAGRHSRRCRNAFVTMLDAIRGHAGRLARRRARLVDCGCPSTALGVTMARNGHRIVTSRPTVRTDVEPASVNGPMSSRAKSRDSRNPPPSATSREACTRDIPECIRDHAGRHSRRCRNAFVTMLDAIRGHAGRLARRRARLVDCGCPSTALGVTMARNGHRIVTSRPTVRTDVEPASVNGPMSSRAKSRDSRNPPPSATSREACTRDNPGMHS